MIHQPLLRAILALLCLLALPLSTQAADDAVERVWQALALRVPQLKPEMVEPSPVPGLYEVTVGPRVFYVSADGRYVIQGDVIDLVQMRNLTQPKVNQAKLRAVEALGEENMLSYGPGDARHTITVFTDIDCGYCRKLHREMADYNAAGIRVRYLFYPRAGVESKSYRKAVSVWCAPDQHQAMDQAKGGEKIEERTCDNPVDRHMRLGEQVGVSGTPALVLADGEVLPGYLPAARLIEVLQELEP
ncbi:MAG: DsbC family protein [gamma proteobacterium symbiont of Phacoides pectinatus]